MKGKDTFTQSEILELKSLIRERIDAEKSKQKVIRTKMRKIGLYGSDDFGIQDMQPSDFERLIRTGRIKVVGQKPVQKIESSKQITKESEYIGSNLKMTNDFTLFDPEKHDSKNIPDNPGNYIICLKMESLLPDIGVPYTMTTYQGLNVIYTGIAGKSLRNRDYKQHFSGNNAGSSTLRKSLGSMFGYVKIPRDRNPNTGKTKFKKTDEIKLSKWMQSNLILYFKGNSKPEIMEQELIGKLNPPLNLSKNSNAVNQEFRNKLSELRSKK